MNADNPHIVLLERAASALAPLPWEFVFVGGATISLYLDDAAAPDIRVTKDVDCVVAVTTYAEYAAVEEALRDQDFRQIVEDDSPICRWSRENLLLDVMPVEPQLLGFGESRWFREGFACACTVTLPSRTDIKILAVPYLLAAKIEAYRDRAGDDYLMSKDFEDIVTILDGRTSIFEELAENGEVQRFIRGWFGQYTSEELEEMLGSHVRDYGRGKWLADRVAELIAAADV
jgi:hypothetical protein